MMLQERIIDEAITWVGTPWQHRQCLRGPHGGVDCVRLLESIAKAVGVLSPDWEPPIYSPEFQLHNNEEVLLAILQDLGCQEKTWEERAIADLLTFQFGRTSSHMALLVARDPDYIIHAARDAGRVVHHRLAGDLLARARGIWAFPGLEEPLV